MSDSHTITWADSRRWPTLPADPRYPNGIDLDMTRGGQGCRVDLPYPAKRCGMYRVQCSECGLTTVITTAGRADDPRSVKLACKR